MFKSIIYKIKEVLYRLNIIKGINSLENHKDIYMNEEMYQKIDDWKALYKGYHEEIHTIKYHTVGKGQQTRRMQTLNMPKVISEEMASLVFNEKCEISIGDEGLKKDINDVFKKNKFYKKFQDYLEYNFAHGGMVIKPYVEGEQIKFSFVTADCFIPISWGNDGVREGVFVNEFRKGNKKYTHLEWHIWENGIYVIRNEVYESKNGNDLGIKVPLERFFPDLDEEVPIENLKRPLFVYFKPNIANNIDTQSPMGISLYANSIDTIKSIDTAFDSFQREFRLGKKRILVPAQMVKTVVDPNTQEFHRYFDADDETYEAMKYQQPEEGKIHDISIELRVEEHISAINAMLNLLAMQTGFSSGTFTFDGQSMKTATEVVSEQSKTFKSKKSHETIIEAGLQELIESIVQIGELYKLISAPKDVEVTVTFDDSVAEDKTAEVARSIQLVSNKLSPRKKEIMKIHGVTEEEALEMMKEIDEENATATAQDVDFFGTGQGSGN
ncbi:phage portal protein [Sediminibacillus massiliensis]|uniref:phage portal protein n=1 Tax=Sediminibacillus massiliensis TaxID=1926277 RepID=UPI0009887C65|nr:phage portal protein [Sediminibacillus massiliensis]